LDLLSDSAAISSSSTHPSLRSNNNNENIQELKDRERRRRRQWLEPEDEVNCQSPVSNNNNTSYDPHPPATDSIAFLLSGIVLGANPHRITLDHKTSTRHVILPPQLPNYAPICRNHDASSF
jgi:hypothetical protein